MSTSKIFLASLIALCVGIGVHTYLPNEPSLFGKISLGFFVVTLGIFILHRRLKNPTIPTILTVLTLLSLGIYRGQSTIHVPTPETIDYYTQANSQSSRIIGTIAEEPDIRRDKINYTIQVQSLITPPVPSVLSVPSPISGYLLVSSGKYPQYKFGDQLEITGNLQKPTVFDSFDYAGYLSRFDIYSVMYRPKIELIKNPSDPPYRPYLSYLFSIKQYFEHHVNLTFPTEPTNSLMAGLLLGSRKGMPEQLTLDFQTTGLTHIIAISGYNITLIVSILLALFKPLGKRLSLLISAIGIILFTLFVGASPAVVRACLMGLIGLLALSSERKGQALLTLLLAGTVMVAWNPKILLYDVGFQLSFLATLGLIIVSPILEPYLQWLPKRLAIRDSITLTLSAQIMALPIILLNFQTLSLISPISNLLVAGPIIPFTMLFGFLGTVASFIWLPIAKLIGFPGYLLSEYLTNVIHLTAQIPYAAIQISWFSKAVFLSYFIGLSFFLWRYWQAAHQRETLITSYQLQFQHLIARQAWLKT